MQSNLTNTGFRKSGNDSSTAFELKTVLSENLVRHGASNEILSDDLPDLKNMASTGVEQVRLEGAVPARSGGRPEQVIPRSLTGIDSMMRNDHANADGRPEQVNPSAFHESSSH